MVVEAIKEIQAEDLAAKIESGEPLTRLEKNALIALLLDYARQRRRRIAGGKKSRGGGRPRSKNPSPAALYQRERRARMKEKKAD